MEKLKRRRAHSVLLQSALLAGVVPGVALAPALHAQESPAVRALLDRAKSQAAHNHPDIAAQTWQQVLLSDPTNREALAGLAKVDMQLGRTEEAHGYLDRLKALGGASADVRSIEQMPTVQSQSARLEQANRAARAGDYAGAAHIYQQVFGDNPPPGNWALAYYDTEAAIPDRRPHAIEGLRRLAQQFPAESRYSITLGRILTYDPKTRAEGIAMLQRYPDSAEAAKALQQAQGWNAIRQAPVESAQAAPTTGSSAQPARVVNSPEAVAYRQLNANQLDAAEHSFRAILATSPNNASALSGLGYVRLKQHEFSEADDYLTRAKAAGATGHGFEDALSLARFWKQMGRAADEQKAGQLQQALADYRAAQQERPGSVEAAEGAAGVLMQQNDSANALPLYQQAVRMAPANSPAQLEAWRGLMLAQAGSGDSQAAIDTATRTPAALQNRLEQDPQYLTALYRAAVATGNTSEANQLLSQVLSLPFPNHGRDLPVSRQMEYAGLLAAAQKYNASLSLYRQVVEQDPGNADAWRAMINVEHQMGNDAQALQLVQQVPPATLDQLKTRSDFLALVGSLYNGVGDQAQAQTYLSQALTASTQQSGDQTGVMLQLAGLDAQQGELETAYKLYSRVLQTRPQDAAAWTGLMNTLHLAHRDRDALARIAGMDEATRMRLEGDPDFQQVLASVQSGAGQDRQALETFLRLHEIYTARQQPMPISAQIQYGWLLNRTGDDRRLYPLVQQLATTPDMTAQEQANYRSLVAAYTMRRGNADLAAGHLSRGISLLEAAHRTFPEDADVSDALAGAYQRAGQSRQALAIYQASNMDNATLPQYRGAIGAALAANDNHDAAAWLQAALARYATDPALLRMAAQYEQARGDSRKAAAYYRAALQMMGDGSTLQGGADTGAQGGAGATLLQLLAPEANTPTRQSNLLGGPSVSTPAADPDMQTQDPVLRQPVRTGVPHSQTLGDLVGDAATPDSSAWPTDGNGVLTDPELPGRRLVRTAPAPDSAWAPAPDNGQAETADADTLGDALVDSDASASVDNLSSAPDGARTVPLRHQRGATQMAAAPADEPLSRPAEAPVQDEAFSAPAQPETASAAAESDAIPDSFVQVAAPPQAAPLVLRTASLRLDPQTVDGQDDGSDLQTAVSALKHKHRTRTATGNTLRPLPSITADNGDTISGRAADPSLGQPQSGTGSSTLAEDAGQTQAQPDLTAPAPAGNSFLSSLPPINGPYQPQPAAPLTPREQVEQQLELIESGQSAWLGGTSSVNYRSGQPGLDQLSIYSAQVESSAMLGPDLRLSVITKPVLLDSGTPTGSGTVQQGTLPLSSTPSQQTASGVGGELQVRGANFGASIGYTPYNFLVSNAIGSVLVQPAGGHFSLSLTRQPIEDTQLSYAGLRDLGSATPLYAGNVWGGVVSDAGELQIASGNAQQGWYIQGGGQYLTGYHVPDNQRADGDAGAYWRVLHDPTWGSVTVGANFFGMHYAKNLRYFTYGQGGYFSPSAYLLGNVPVTVSGHYGNRFHYQVVGSLGVQAFTEDSTPYFPLDLATQIAAGNPYYPGQTSVGANYDLQSEGAYAIADHWYVGGYLNANNSRDYANVRAGFYVRYMFRPQPELGDVGPTGLFPAQGLRPFRVP